MIKGKTKRQSIRESWTISDYRFVCYIDIMGFKNLVQRNSHDRIYRMMKKVSEALNNTEAAFSTDTENEFDDVSITMTTYSDSIMMYSKDNSEENLLNFLSAVGSLIEDLFLAEIPFRGAVAYGMMTLDFKNSIFFGRPLIDAYLLSEELSFYGVVVHASAESKMGLKESNAIIEYMCPFKTGASQHYTIIPSMDILNQFDKLEGSVNLLRKKTSGGLRKYIDNTIQYLQTVKKEKMANEKIR
jgi:hypothetical protein